MPEAVFSARRKLFRYVDRLTGFILGLLGVISVSCGIEPVAYGPPDGCFITGLVKDNGTAVQGIEINVQSPDSSIIYHSTETSSDGAYWADLYEWPDSLLITASDIDGPDNGSYLPEGKYITDIPEEGSLYYTVDFELEPDPSK